MKLVGRGNPEIVYACRGRSKRLDHCAGRTDPPAGYDQFEHPTRPCRRRKAALTSLRARTPPGVPEHLRDHLFRTAGGESRSSAQRRNRTRRRRKGDSNSQSRPGSQGGSNSLSAAGSYPRPAFSASRSTRKRSRRASNSLMPRPAASSAERVASDLSNSPVACRSSADETTGQDINASRAAVIAKR
jgi:hypothetical protein